jgi:acetolactate synthase-1/2/3 large subunit
LSRSWRKADAHNGPVLIEFVVEQHDMVYPMVPAGADLDEMIRRPHKQFKDMEM